MKVQCDGCERAEAVIVCCADEAALCRECDIRVHEANKLAGKHQRVPLSRPANNTQCDICQEKTAYFFCLEDRALLCHNCDMSIHRLNAPTSNHRRFLITGVTASLHTLSGQAAAAAAAAPGTPPPVAKPTSRSNHPNQRNKPVPVHLQATSQPHPVPLPPKCLQSPQIVHVPEAATAATAAAATSSNSSKYQQAEPAASRKTSIFEFLTEAVPGWKCDELLNMAESYEGIGVSNLEPKMDQTSFNSANYEQFCSRSVPEMSLLPTGTGLSKYTETTLLKPRTTKQHDIFFPPDPDDSFIVPDLGLYSAPELPPVMKKRRAYHSELDNIFMS